MHLSMQKNIVKKMASDVDNYAAFSEKRYQMICQIQNFLKEGCSYREIAKRMGIGRNTIAKYRKGDPKELSMYGMNNPVPVSLLSGDRKPQIRFLGNHPSGSGNLYHKSFRM